VFSYAAIILGILTLVLYFVLGTDGMTWVAMSGVFFLIAAIIPSYGLYQRIRYGPIPDTKGYYNALSDEQKKNVTRWESIYSNTSDVKDPDSWWVPDGSEKTNIKYLP
jgi:Na+(H+)/acetate symporter ActP